VLRHVCQDKTPYRMDPGKKVTLYLPNVCSQTELANRNILKGRDDYWILDTRGQGESAFTPEDVFSPYGQDYAYAGHALLYGEELLGDRLFDVLSTVNLLRAEGARQIHLVGRGQGAMLALLAGVLDSRIADVASQGAPESILAMCCEPLNYWPTANFPRGILKHFDLPDLRKALGKRLVKDTCVRGGNFTA